MKNYKIKVEDIFEHTDGGLDIIRYYIHDIDRYISSNKHFAIRDENTPSCSIKRMPDGNYVITDFGPGEKYNGIALIQHMEKVTFGEAVKIAAERHNIPNAENVSELFNAAIKREPASPDQKEGERSFHYLEEVPEKWLEIIYSRSVFTHLEYKFRNTPESERREKILTEIRADLRRHHWHAIDYYTIVKNRMVTKISSSEYYPIFSIEEKHSKDKHFRKIYQPMARDKKHRFFYHGDFNSRFLHGLFQAEKLHQKLLQDQAEGEGEDDKKQSPKLSEIIYCPGGSDALNLSILGYNVIYPSSEHFKLDSHTLRHLFNISRDVITIPDLDETGQRVNHELCLNTNSELYLDIRVADLPAKLALKRDRYNRPCKDVRDFLQHFPARELNGHIKTARKYKFWDTHFALDRSGSPKIKYGQPVVEYKLSAERILYFLSKNGFHQYDLNKETTIFVQIEGNVVKPVKPEEVKGFLISFLRKRFFHEDLLNIVHNSPIVTDRVLTSLSRTEVDFSDYSRDSQYMFFQNSTWLIKAEGIEVLGASTSDKYVWYDKILPYSVKKRDDMFKIEQTGEDSFSIDIYNTDCMFFRYMIQTSRVHWREELDNKLANLSPEDQAKYLEENKFNIAGPLLSEQERNDQKLHLMNKIYAMGYLIHRYKNPSRAWIVLAMDDTPKRDSGSHGGTGKSIFFKALSHIKEQIFLDGKQAKLFDDAHVFEQVTKSTDIVYIDDAAQYFPFESTFSKVTGSITVNPKGKTRTTMDFAEAPKLGMSTNYSPDDLSPSTLRRILFIGMSDYYHANDKGEFSEKRQPIDDFGKNLFSDFTDDEWEATLNFLAQCCKAYLSLEETIHAPMKNIMERSLTHNMGINFLSWAEVFFSETTINKHIPRSVAIESYVRDAKIKSITAQGFMSKLRLFAQLKSYSLNPKELTNKDGRIIKLYDTIEYDNRIKSYIKPGGKKTQEFIYLKEPGKDLTDDIYDPVLESEIDSISSEFPDPLPSAGTTPLDF